MKTRWALVLVFFVSLVTGGLAAVGVGGAAFLQHQHVETEKRRELDLGTVRTLAEKQLQLQAFELVQDAVLLGADSTLLDVLAEIEQGIGEPGLIRQTAHKRLAQLTRGRPWEFVGLLAQNGAVLARVGLLENQTGDFLYSWPIVQLALRGHRADDLWQDQTGQVYVVAAVPLPSLSRQHFAGVLLLGAQLPQGLGEKQGLSSVWHFGQKASASVFGPPPPDAVALVRPGSVKDVTLYLWSKHNRPFETFCRFLKARPVLPASCGLAWFLVCFLTGLFQVRAPQPPQTSHPLPGADFGPRTLEQLPQLFAEFVSAKAARGEALDGLSFEVFCAEIGQTVRTVLAQTGCDTVLFRVVPGGPQVTLRATPVGPGGPVDS